MEGWELSTVVPVVPRLSWKAFWLMSFNAAMSCVLSAFLRLRPLLMLVDCASWLRSLSCRSNTLIRDTPYPPYPVAPPCSCCTADSERPYPRTFSDDMLALARDCKWCHRYAFLSSRRMTGRLGVCGWGWGSCWRRHDLPQLSFGPRWGGWYRVLLSMGQVNFCSIVAVEGRVSSRRTCTKPE